MTRRKRFAVENYATEYAQVQATWQNPERAARLHRALGRLLQPRVIMADGASEQLESALAHGGQAAIAMSHGSSFDPLNIAAMAERTAVFRPMIGQTMIGAKVDIHATPVIGALVPDLGSIPIWRKHDVLRACQTEAERELALGLQKAAGHAFIATEIAGMNQGRHMIKHVEGTRNKRDPRTVQTVYDGFGKVVCGVDPERSILLMAGAFCYETADSLLRYTRPVMYIDVLDDQQRDDPTAVMAIVKPALQQCLDSAYHYAAVSNSVIN